MSFILASDSSCDLTMPYIREHGIKLFSLTYHLDDKDYLDDLFETVSPKEFYDDLRAGKISKTSQVNSFDFAGDFEKWAKNGDEVVYIAFSEGLSGTYQSSIIARDEVLEKYPGAKIHIVNTHAASGGQGFLLMLAQRMRDAGKTAGETIAEIERVMKDLCHFVVIDDLKFLQRGGRISSTVAFFGGMLDIKPLIYVDDAGKLISWTKSRGRKSSIKKLAEYLAEYIKDPGPGLVVITHGDCEDDANTLKEYILQEYPEKEIYISYIGPVIGSHSGPGTLALFFEGTTKDPTKKS